MPEESFSHSPFPYLINLDSTEKAGGTMSLPSSIPPAEVFQGQLIPVAWKHHSPSHVSTCGLNHLEIGKV